jgi:hypothetical protein
MRTAVSYRISGPTGVVPDPSWTRPTGKWPGPSTTVAGTCGCATAALEFLAGRGMKSARVWFTQR